MCRWFNRILLPVTTASRSVATACSRASSTVSWRKSFNFRGLFRFDRTPKMVCSRFVADRLLLPTGCCQQPIALVAMSGTRWASARTISTFRWSRWKPRMPSNIRATTQKISIMTSPLFGCRAHFSIPPIFNRFECPRWHSLYREC